MKPIRLLILVLVAVTVFSACKSEKEREMARMVDSLDSAWAIHEETVSAFFNSVDAMKAAMKPVRIYGRGEDTLMPGEAGQVWAEASQRPFDRAIPGPNGKLRTAEPISWGINTCALLYDDSLWNVHSMAFFRTWEGLPALHLDHLYGHLKEQVWDDLFYHENQISVDGEEREDFLKRGLDLMEKIGKIRYLLVMQPVLFVPGRGDGNSYEPGHALAKVQLWDLSASKFTGHFWIKAVNSLSIMTLTYENQSKQEAIARELEKDLNRNLYGALRSEMGDAVDLPATSD